MQVVLGKASRVEVLPKKVPFSCNLNILAYCMQLNFAIHILPVHINCSKFSHSKFAAQIWSFNFSNFAAYLNNYWACFKTNYKKPLPGPMFTIFVLLEDQKQEI